MEKASVSQLRASPGRYLARVKAGEEVLVTERGRPVARIVPLSGDEASSDDKLARLERAGLARRGNGALSAGFWDAKGPEDKEGRGLAALLSDREEGR